MIDLKLMKDIGYNPATEWLNFVSGRWQAAIGKEVTESVMETVRDNWRKKKCS